MLTKNGYTLLETIIVLLLISTFLIIAVPTHNKTLERYTFRNFYQQFEDDVLLTQQLSMTHQSFYDLMIVPSQRKYYLMDTRKELKIIERSIPPSIKIDLQTLQMPIRFSSEGTIYNPGSMRIRTYSNIYKVVFPFGKSRCYMNEI